MICDYLNSRSAGSRAYHRSRLSRVENWRSPLHFSRSYCTSWGSGCLVGQHYADHAAHVVFCFQLSSSLWFFFYSSQLCCFAGFCIFLSSIPLIPLCGEAFTHLCATSSSKTQPRLNYLTTSLAAFVARGDHWHHIIVFNRPEIPRLAFDTASKRRTTKVPFSSVIAFVTLTPSLLRE
jgi:hypothetical protein